MPDFFDHFRIALPPDPGVKRLEGAELDALRTPSTPSALLEVFGTLGTGSFGGGVLFVLPPPVLQPMLDVWIPASPKRIPFARTAFGEIFYWRDLADEARASGMTGENPGELGDVSWVDVHFGAIAVVATTIEELFDDILGEPANVDGILRGGLARAAQEIHGALDAQHQLAFVPALALGGTEDLASVQRVDMRVHTTILRQLGS
jgi:hypothetical protein